MPAHPARRCEKTATPSGEGWPSCKKKPSTKHYTDSRSISPYLCSQSYDAKYTSSGFSVGFATEMRSIISSCVRGAQRPSRRAGRSIRRLNGTSEVLEGRPGHGSVDRKALGDAPVCRAPPRPRFVACWAAPLAPSDHSACRFWSTRALSEPAGGDGMSAIRPARGVSPETRR